MPAPIAFSEPQALALITDAGTLKRGQELARPAKWANLGRTATAAWGECAGSGAKPYLAGLDLTEPAFKCSCPSRVFPCKHGAALLLLLARQPATFAGGTPPAWLSEWLEKRQKTQEKKVEKVIISKATRAPKTDASTTPETAAETGGAESGTGLEVDAKRLARMETGAADLAAWLEDLMRAGLASLDQQPPKFWENQAARLVDQQLPGLAATVRQLATLRHAHPDWPARLLGRLGELYLLVRAFRNRPVLASEARQEVLQQVGVSLKKEALLTTTAPVADEWQVLGQYQWEEDRLTARRTWLHGRTSGRPALVLEFAFGGQGFATALLPRAHYRGELAFYPGLLPLRAAAAAGGMEYLGAELPTALPGQCISELLESYADALARQPWLREWPALLARVVLVRQPDGRWQLRHPTEAAVLPLRFLSEDAPWQLLAESGGQPINLFGEWDGQAFRVLDSWPTDTIGIVSEAEPTNGSAALVTAPAAAETDGTPAPDGHQPGQPASAAAPTERGLGAGSLLRMALLGTRQSSEPLPPFPVPADTREQQLLLAAGTLALLQKAGFQPPTAHTALPTPAAPDPRPPLGPAGATCLRQLFDQSDLQTLLPDYLVRVGEAERLIPAAELVPLLHLATRSAVVAARLGPVLGQRGRWLAALNPAWSALLQKHVAPETLADDLGPWETGTLPERLAWLEQRFAQNADAARALLLAALPTEPAKVQEPLLELLADHLHPDTEPALENLLRARAQDVRRRATELLVQLPGAALTERLWARAAPLLSVRRKLLGLGAASLEVALPTDWDKAWLLDGIEEKNARFMSAHGPSFTTPVGPATARLANLLALLPPARWTAHLGLNPAELLAAALASEWTRPLLPAWAESTLLHHDAAFAAAFLGLWFEQRPSLKKAHLDQGINWAGLAALLPDATSQQLVLQPVLERVRRRETNWLWDAGFVPAPWPRPLTAAVLAAVAEKLANTASFELLGVSAESRELAWWLPQTVAACVAPADMAWAIAQVEAIPQVNTLFQSPINQFTDLLRFRLSLEASLRE